jgi:heat shock protein HslJ
MRIVYLFILLLFACRPSNQLSELVGATNERPLEGTVWLLAELNGKEIGLAENQKAIFVFYEINEKKVRGFGGCNSFTGSFTQERSTISATLASTRMFCEGKMDVETEFMKVLSIPCKYEMDGNHLFLKIDGMIIAKFRPEVKTSG